MATPVWYLEYFASRAAASGGRGSGDLRTLTAWGFESSQLHFANEDIDTLTVQRTGYLEDQYGAPTGTPLFNKGDICKLWQDSHLWFTGIFLPSEKSGSPDSETLGYKWVSPWYELEKTVFRQPWGGFVVNPGVTIAPSYPASAGISYSASASSAFMVSHIMANVDNFGDTVGTRLQLAALLNYAATGCGIPIQFTQSELVDQLIPWEEYRDVTIAEGVRRQIQMLPNCGVWFDYSVYPPKLNVMGWQSLPQVSLPLAGLIPYSPNGWHESVNVSRVWEQELPSVDLIFETTSTVDGEPKKSWIEERAPSGSTGREPGAMVATIDLEGAQITTINATIRTQAFAANHGSVGSDATRIAWWKTHQPQLNRFNIVDGTISIDNVEIMDVNTGATGTPDPSTYPRELLEGNWAPWMGISYKEVEVRATATYSLRNVDIPALLAKTGPAENFHVKVRLTNGSTGTYGGIASVDSGEPAPLGLAAYMWACLGDNVSLGGAGPRFQGRASWVEDEVLGFPASSGGAPQLGLGVRINLTGAASGDGWATMKSTLQSIDYDLESGRTAISFGPPRNQTIPNLLQLLRMNRWRRKWTNPAVKTTGAGALSGSADIGNPSKENSVANANSPWINLGSYAATGWGGDIVHTAQVTLQERGPAIYLQSYHRTAASATDAGPAASANGIVQIEAWAASGHIVTLRPQTVCLDDGSTQTRLFLCSEPY